MQNLKMSKEGALHGQVDYFGKARDNSGRTRTFARSPSPKATISFDKGVPLW